MEITPAILEQTWPEAEKKLKLVDSLTDWIQLDVSDGIFTPKKTWNNPGDLLGLNPKSKLEVHLMISDPEVTLKNWFINPVGRIVVQVESLSGVQHLVLNKEKEIVLGFKIETPWESYWDLIQQVEQVLFLAVDPGYQGQKFDDKVIGKVKTLKAARPHVKISVDGGINLSNIGEIASSGADAAVVGSAIFGSADPSRIIQEFKNTL